MTQQPRLYSELADWWPLLSAPAGYAAEASLYCEILCDLVDRPIERLLELGCGGGNNASHMPAGWALTLVDRSDGMLACSAALNPRARHREADMRTARLGEVFDAVFVHDAVTYMTREEDLRAVFETAWVHTRPGGAALFVPDWTRESFAPASEHGGHDGAGRSLRYLSWIDDPDPTDTSCRHSMVYLLREEGRPDRVVHDDHPAGLFPRATWLDGLERVGFAVDLLDARALREDWQDPPELFAARRPA